MIRSVALNSPPLEHAEKRIDYMTTQAWRLQESELTLSSSLSRATYSERFVKSGSESVRSFEIPWALDNVERDESVLANETIQAIHEQLLGICGYSFDIYNRKLYRFLRVSNRNIRKCQQLTTLSAEKGKWRKSFAIADTLDLEIAVRYLTSILNHDRYSGIEIRNLKKTFIVLTEGVAAILMHEAISHSFEYIDPRSPTFPFTPIWLRALARPHLGYDLDDEGVPCPLGVELIQEGLPTMLVERKSQTCRDQLPSGMYITAPGAAAGSIRLTNLEISSSRDFRQKIDVNRAVYCHGVSGAIFSERWIVMDVESASVGPELNIKTKIQPFRLRFETRSVLLRCLPMDFHGKSQQRGYCSTGLGTVEIQVKSPPLCIHPNFWGNVLAE
jgi:hypothetical protein